MSNDAPSELAKFGLDFQEKLVQLLIDDKEFCDQIGEVMEVEFLAPKHLRYVSEVIFNYKKKYDVHPTRSAMVALIKGELSDKDESLLLSVNEYFGKINKRKGPLAEAEFIKDKSLDFCRRRAIERALYEAIHLTRDSNYGAVLKCIEGAMAKGSDNKVGYLFKDDFEARYGEEYREAIPTGIETLDNLTKGGLGKKEMAVIIAPTGVGKTTMMCSIVGNMVMAEKPPLPGVENLTPQGYTIVYYTFEVADKPTAKRIDSRITGIDIDDIDEKKEEVKIQIDACPGTLIVKEYPMKGATIQTIKNHLEKLKRLHIFPDAIVIDYGDLIKPSNNKAEASRHALQEIFEEIRGIGQAYNAAMLTATQTNRGGYKAEVVSMDAIAEAFNKCFAADLIITLSSKRKAKIEKNRNGRDKVVFQLIINHAKNFVDFAEEVDEEELNEAVAERAAEVYHEFLREGAQRVKQRGGN